MQLKCLYPYQRYQCLIVPVRSSGVAGGMPMIHKASSSSGQSTSAAAAAAPIHVQQALMGKQMLDMVDGFGRAPLHVAAAAGRVDVVQQLLFGGCDYTKALQADFRCGTCTSTGQCLIFKSSNAHQPCRANGSRCVC